MSGEAGDWAKAFEAVNVAISMNATMRARMKSSLARLCADARSKTPPLHSDKGARYAAMHTPCVAGQQRDDTSAGARFIQAAGRGRLIGGRSSHGPIWILRPPSCDEFPGSVTLRRGHLRHDAVARCACPPFA